MPELLLIILFMSSRLCVFPCAVPHLQYPARCHFPGAVFLLNNVVALKVCDATGDAIMYKCRVHINLYYTIQHVFIKRKYRRNFL